MSSTLTLRVVRGHVARAFRTSTVNGARPSRIILNRTFTTSGKQLAGTTIDDKDEGAVRYETVYESKVSQALRTIKIISFTSCLASITAGPVIAIYGNQSISMNGRLAIGAIIATMGIFTTASLHSFAKGYVTKLEYDEENQKLRVSKVGLMGQVLESTVSLDDVGPIRSVHPYLNVRMGNQDLYVPRDQIKHPDLLKAFFNAEVDDVLEELRKEQPQERGS
eukprot:Clim_evm14s222 gene=Clim_evmTU14s222